MVVLLTDSDGPKQLEAKAERTAAADSIEAVGLPDVTVNSVFIPPPAYTESAAPTEPPAPGPQHTEQPAHTFSAFGWRPPPEKPSNLFALSRPNGQIRGQFVLDPTLQIPPAILPAPAPGETRKNLKLEARNGNVAAEVWLVRRDARAGPEKVRATIGATSRNGNVSLKIRTQPNASVPFVLNASSSNGNVTLHVPHTFCGPITAFSRNGSITYSSALRPHVTVFSDVDKRRQAFLGDFAASGWGDAPELWAGDEIRVETQNGSIRISYVDEQADAGSQNGSGWGSKLLGWGNQVGWFGRSS